MDGDLGAFLQIAFDCSVFVASDFPFLLTFLNDDHVVVDVQNRSCYLVVLRTGGVAAEAINMAANKIPKTRFMTNPPYLYFVPNTPPATWRIECLTERLDAPENL